MIVTGTVGWEGFDNHFSKGTDGNDGHTFVYVQLYSGRDHSKKKTPSIGQGKQIVCHLSSSIFRIPPKGTRVYIAMPTGQDTAVGSGVIFATVEKSPTIQFEEDRAVLDYGPDTHVVIRGKSVSISDPDNNFISVGEPRSGGDAGIIFQASDGCGGIIKEGVVSWFATTGPGGSIGSMIQLQETKLDVVVSNGGYMLIDGAGGGKFETFGFNNFMKGTCWLGAAPTLLTSATYTILPNVPPPGQTAISLGGSASVYISPV